MTDLPTLKSLLTPTENDYAQAYRDLHPRQFPFSPWERQMELRDLWPADQERFRETVRGILKTVSDQK